MASSLPGDALAIRCDVADGASVAALVAEVVRVAGGFDILVNNAALTQKPARIAKTPERELDRLLAVNVKSLYHMAVHALPVLAPARRRRRDQHRVGGGDPAAARHDLVQRHQGRGDHGDAVDGRRARAGQDTRQRDRAGGGAHRDVRRDVRRQGGRRRRSACWSRSRSDGCATPEDIASAAVYLASDEAAFVTGVVLPVDGGRLVG